MLERKVEILVDSEWVETHMSDLKPDDVFRLFDPFMKDDEVEWIPLMEGQMYIALEYAIPQGNTWGISCEPIEGVIDALGD